MFSVNVSRYNKVKMHVTRLRECGKWIFSYSFNTYGRFKDNTNQNWLSNLPCKRKPVY